MMSSQVNQWQGIITKHAFCLFHWPKLHYILGAKNKEVRLKLTLRNNAKSKESALSIF